jgi:hypothetical protein
VPRDRNPDATEPSHHIRYRPPVVRTASRPRRSTLTLLALGVLAAVVAVAGNTQPTQPAAATPADTAPTDEVRGLDFSAIAQPGVACSDALPETAPSSIGVTAGESALLDEATFARLEIDPDVLYADLDGDGDDEAVVRATCSFGANGAEETVQVWTANGRLPLLVDTVTGPPDSVADDSRFPPSLLDVAVDGGELQVTFGVYDDDAPHCCPTSEAVVTYELDGGLSVVGRPQVRPTD